MNTVNKTARRSDAQHGAATLVIVMMLFLIMALLAAYANRSLMFEQRMSSSYFRASAAQEASEAGIEWTIAQLNGEAINASCAPVATGGVRFADRYLAISAADRNIKQSGSALVLSPAADCTRSASGWTCSCPAPGSWAAPAAAAGTAITPSFGIWLQPHDSSSLLPAGAGTVLLNSLGCTNSVVSSCSDGASTTRATLGASKQLALVALVSAVRSPPAAPLVVKGNVSVSGTGLGLHNTDVRSAGLLYDVGGSVSGFNDTRLNSVPGTSPSLARISGDATLGSDVFRMFMGMTPQRYKSHPSLRTEVCSGDCGATLAAAYAAGRRIIWVEGDLSIQSNQTLGSATDPVVIIASGNIALDGPFKLTGMLVALGDLGWTNSSGTSMVVGAVLVNGHLTTNGSMDIVYQPAIADQLRNRMGSFVRVSGGWTDTTTD